MLGIFDTLAKIASPELMQVVETLPQKVEEWSRFLAELKSALRHLDARGETVDSKLSYLCGVSEEISDKLTLLMTESAVTPELHDAVLAMAEDDPRNLHWKPFPQ